MSLRDAFFAACVGVTLEVVFTAFYDFVHTPFGKERDWALPGKTYVTMMPIYATVPFVLAVVHALGMSQYPLLIRLWCEFPLGMVGEVIWGFLLRRALGKAPWEDSYRTSPYALFGGLTRLDYWPVWLVGTLVYEVLFVR